MAETATGRTELLQPDGNARMVVTDEIVPTLVEKGYIVIEPTTLPITHEPARFGISVHSEMTALDTLEVLDEDDDDGTSNASLLSTSVNALVAIAEISEMTTPEEVEAYVSGDDRVTVKTAAEDRVDALSVGNE